MAIRNVLHYPDPRLRKKALPVETIDDSLKPLIDDMFETMYHHDGAGLAATQINVQQRIFVMDMSGDSSNPIALINPEILHSEGTRMWEEGCLSVPGFFESVKRAEFVKARWFDIDGKEHLYEGDDRTADCFQHEIDHLDGVLFIDHLSSLKRNRIKKKLEKIRQKTL